MFPEGTLMGRQHIQVRAKILLVHKEDATIDTRPRTVQPTSAHQRGLERLLLCILLLADDLDAALARGAHALLLG